MNPFQIFYQTIMLPPWAYIVFSLVEVFVLIHAIKSGRIFPWLYIIMFVPGLGILAYVLIEILPEMSTGSLMTSVSSLFHREPSLQQLLQLADEYPTAAHLEALADAYVKQGNYQAAIPLYQRCLEGIHQEDAYTHHALANCYFLAGHLSEALAETEVVATLGEEIPDDYLLHARILDVQGHDKEAEAWYEKAYRRHSSLIADYYYGLFLKKLGKLTEVQQLRLKAIKKHQDYVPRYRRIEKVWLEKIKKELS